MRRGVIASIMSSWVLGLCQLPVVDAVARIDVSAEVTRPPDARTGRLIPLPAQALDGPPSAVTLKALYRSDHRDGIANHLIRITNVSTTPVNLPVSRDGEKAYEVCANHDVVESFISHVPKGEEPSKGTISAELYGCESFKESIIALRPGGSLELDGVVELGSPALDHVPESIYIVSDHKFSGAGSALQSITHQEFVVPIRMEDSKHDRVE